MPHEQRLAISLPVYLNEELRIVGFTDNRDIQIRLPKGAFIHAKAFLHAIENGKVGEVFRCGRIVIRVQRNRELEVKDNSPSGKSFTYQFDDELCDELDEHISWIAAKLKTYAPDPNAMKRAAQKRLEARERRAKAA
jgi:hypothetical protein